MIAVLIATGQNPAFYGLDEYLPAPLLPLVDRPFVQHVIEYLARQGIRRFELILSHLPEKIEAALGDGARWGCNFGYHLLPLGGDPFRMARTIAGDSPETVVLGTAACLPDCDLHEVTSTMLLCQDGRWTGWGVFAPADLDACAGDAPDAGLQRREVARWLSIENGEDFLLSQQHALEGVFPGLLISGREVDPGIWISRNVALHPSAKLTAPVYIGENCRIGKGCEIGPAAVVGSNCIVDSQTIVSRSMIAPGTYAGEGLELESVIVDRNRLVNVRLGTSFLVSETFLLGSLTERARGRGTARLLSQAMAFGLLLFLWPLLLLTALWRIATGRGGLRFAPSVQIPADDNPAAWRFSGVCHFAAEGNGGRAAEFFLRFLPGLLSVVAGSVFLVGVRPRTSEEVMALPADWRALYLKTKAGLITEAGVMFGGAPSEDEMYTAEAFYSATESTGRDARLFALWAWKLIAGGHHNSAGFAEEPPT